MAIVRNSFRKIEFKKFKTRKIQLKRKKRISLEAVQNSFKFALIHSFHLQYQNNIILN